MPHIISPIYGSPYRKIKKKPKSHLRDNPTSPERQAWKLLREYGFDRRQSIGGFIADFINYKYRRVVQISNPQSQREKDDDARTDTALANAGYLVFRFHPDEVESCLGRVVLGNHVFEKGLAEKRYQTWNSR